MVQIEMQGTIQPSLTLDQIIDIEKKLGIILPLEYKEFLLNQNGGYPKACEFDLPDGTNSSIVNQFYPIGDMPSNLYKRNRCLEDGAAFIAIGDDPGGNQILLRIKGENIGALYFYHHDVDSDTEETMHFLAKGLLDFLKILK